MHRARSVQQQTAADRELRDALRAECGVGFEGANHLELARGQFAISGRFIAVQLHRIKRHGARDAQHILYIHIYEYTDQLGPCGNGARNLLRLLQGNTARAFVIEVHPEHRYTQ